MKNHHIREACKQYITQKSKPEYAVFIDGPWGCGKTYFVDELLKETWLKGTKNKKVVKISLYGVNTKDDIGRLIFNEEKKLELTMTDEEFANGNAGKNIWINLSSYIHNRTIKKLKEEQPSWVKGILAGTDAYIKGSFHIGIETIMPFLIEDSFKKIGVIIIDDLERASMPMHEIMGYFSNYIIEHNIRMIFIGNEKEIKNSNGDKDVYFTKTKEKVIGESYTIQPQVEDAINEFLSRDLILEISVSKALDVCVKVVEQLQMKNLRTVWQALVHIQRLLTSVVDCQAIKDVKVKGIEYKDGDNTIEDYLAEILELYLVLYLQKAEGWITKSNTSSNSHYVIENDIISSAIGAYKNRGYSIEQLNREKDSVPLEKNIDNMTKVGIKFLQVPRGFVALYSSNGNPTSVWSDFLFESKLDKDMLNKVVYEDSNWFTPKISITSNLYKLVSESLYLGQEEFEKYYDAVVEEFMNGKYVELGELMHGYSLCLSYQKHKVKYYEDGELNRLFDTILENTNISVDIDASPNSMFFVASMGYSYSSDMNIGEGLLFLKKLESLVNIKRDTIVRSLIVEEFDAIQNTSLLSHWLDLFSFNSGNRNPSNYYDKPVLCWIGSDKIFDKLIIMEYGDQFRFFKIMRDRSASGDYSDDSVVIEEISEKYSERINKLGLGSIENYRLNLILQLIKTINYTN